MIRSAQFVQETTAPTPSSATASFWPQFRQRNLITTRSRPLLGETVPPECRGPWRQSNQIPFLRKKSCANNQVIMNLAIEDFLQEMAGAVKSYEKFVVCVEKTPDEFLKSLQSLMAKAIAAFENREPGLRHGIALDRQVTIILSQNDDVRPLCGIYFNLHSPYRKKTS